MHTTNLRKVGGSVMMAVPPAILKRLHLRAGARVDLTIDGEQLVISPKTRPRYTLEELLAQCDTSIESAPEEREWLDDSATGRELL